MVAVVIPERVAAKAAQRYTVVGDCWVTGYSIVKDTGYGQIGWATPGDRHKTTVHRAAWAFWNEAQPGELTVDHTCRNRACVRPEHLRLLTNAENARRNAPDRDYPLNWTCRKNHDSARNAAGNCIECRREWYTRYNRKVRAA